MASKYTATKTTMNEMEDVENKIIDLSTKLRQVLSFHKNFVKKREQKQQQKKQDDGFKKPMSPMLYKTLYKKKRQYSKTNQDES